MAAFGEARISKGSEDNIFKGKIGLLRSVAKGDDLDGWRATVKAQMR